APRDLIMVRGNPITRSRLEDAGCKITEFDGGEICIPGAGGPTCLTRPLLRGWVMDAEHVAIVRAGAVVGYFGGMLARAGVPVTLIGRAAHVDAIKRDGLFLERNDFQEYVRVIADTRIEAIRDASIVLLSVKTTDTEGAAAAIAPNLQSRALL